MSLQPAGACLIEPTTSITLISRIKRSVNGQLRLNPTCALFPCSRLFVWIFSPAGPARYNEGFPQTLVGVPPWTPLSN